MLRSNFLEANSESIFGEESAETQTCTGDARLFRPALYYLSYLGEVLP